MPPDWEPPEGDDATAARTLADPVAKAILAGDVDEAEWVDVAARDEGQGDRKSGP